MEAKTKILPGEKYGRLMVLSKTGSRKWGQVVWRCRCSCKAAKDVDVTSRNLKSGRTTSCGCALSDLLRERNRKTGWHDLSREIAELASAHEAAIELLAGEITWNTKSVVRGRCGHERRTNIATFLERPGACRRCNKRLSPDALAPVLANRGILLQHIDYDSDLQGRSIGHCKCKICHFKFSRTVGELSSGNRGCPNCTDIQGMYVRTIFADNFGGTFQIRVRPKWMRGLELDGWNEEVSIKGRTVAFDIMGNTGTAQM